MKIQLNQENEEVARKYTFFINFIVFISRVVRSAACQAQFHPLLKQVSLHCQRFLTIFQMTKFNIHFFGQYSVQQHYHRYGRILSQYRTAISYCCQLVSKWSIFSSSCEYLRFHSSDIYRLQSSVSQMYARTPLPEDTTA